MTHRMGGPVEEKTREELLSRFARYSRYQRHFEKAVDIALEGSVKEHVFAPTGRRLYTVVGRGGDEFIDPEKPFCSCPHFFFKVLGGRDEICYHLLGYAIAKEAGLLDRIDFEDEEYDDFMRLVVSDLLNQ
jgi:predicted nucleic acid-binding Zn finger protein